MKLNVCAVSLLFLVGSVAVAQQSTGGKDVANLPSGATLLFEDDFERNESQEEKDEPGNGWTTNSEKRAAGNKQVDLIDGAMHIYIHAEANHGVSVVHDAAFENGLIKLRFMLPEKSSSLTLDFADLKYKAVHAGHLSRVGFKTNHVEIADVKTGIFDKKIYQARKAKTLTDEQKKMLKTKSKKFKRKLEPGKWFAATVKFEGETLSVGIDGEFVGEFSSPGIAHPTKRMIRLAVPKKAAVDDMQIYSLSQ